MRFVGPASGCPAKPPLEMADVADNDLATGSSLDPNLAG